MTAEVINYIISFVLGLEIGCIVSMFTLLILMGKKRPEREP
jgi:hypothetical protein